MGNTKVCKKCGRELPTSEFYKDKSREDGFQFYCKDCLKQDRKKYYADNKEAICEAKKQYYDEHKEEKLAYHKQWYDEHREEQLEKMKKYYVDNADFFRAYDKQRYATIERYSYNIRNNNLYADIKRHRIHASQDPLPPLSYYIEKFSEGIDYYDGKKYPFNELGFDRIDNSKPHTIDNMVVATTEHNIDRWHKQMTVEEYKEYIQKLQI